MHLGKKSFNPIDALRCPSLRFAKHHLIADAHAERTHQSLARTLSARISSCWNASSVHASVPIYAYTQRGFKGSFQIWNFYAYAEHTRKKLHVLRVCISSVIRILTVCTNAHKGWGIRVKKSKFLIIFKDLKQLK
jgi:hypothetical protein